MVSQVPRMDQVLQELTQDAEHTARMVAQIAEFAEKNPYAAVELFDALVARNTQQRALTPAVTKALTKTYSQKRASDLLLKLGALQKNKVLSQEQHLHALKTCILNYLEDTWVDRVPCVYDPHRVDLENMPSSYFVINYVKRHYKDWQKLRWAIEDGTVDGDVTYHLWQRNGCKVKFKWGFRWLLLLEPDFPPEHRESDLWRTTNAFIY